MHIQVENKSCIFKTMIVHAYSRREHVQQSVQVLSKYKKEGWDYSSQFISATCFACFLPGPEFPIIVSSVTTVACYLTTNLFD